MEKRQERESETTYQKVVKIVSLVGFLASVILCVIGWKMGIFSSQERLQQFVNGFGFWGPLIFVVYQAVQVVIPIMPGGISCLGGVILFGPIAGFIYNYVGICAGSVLAFLVARMYGRPLLIQMFGERRMEKYGKWLAKGGKFTKMFAISIFLPVAPDDFLCYWAGTTEMTLPIFTVIILLGKPFAIALYSLGLTVVFKKFF